MASPGTRSGGRWLDRDTIVAAALEIAHLSQNESVTVRELGTRLGADPTAIYRHFDNKDSLLRALLDHVIGVALDRIEVPATDWRTYLWQSAVHTLDVFCDYPAISVEAVRLTTGGQQELRAVEGILMALHSAGLDEDAILRHYGVMSAWVLSVASGIAQTQRVNGAKGADPTLWMVQPFGGDLSGSPMVAEHGTRLRALAGRELYENGLDILLNAVELEAATRDRSAAPHR